MMKRLLAILLAALLFCGASCFVFAEPDDEAADLTAHLLLFRSSKEYEGGLRDGRVTTYLQLIEGEYLTLRAEEPIAYLYLVFDRAPGAWELSEAPETEGAPCGGNGFLHELVDVREAIGDAQSELILTFPEGAVLAEIRAFSAGTLPEEVQDWRSPDSKADLLLVATHSDDDALIFTGLVPTYTVRGLRVQVAYFTCSPDDHDRMHEMLNGLWHAGLTRYPVISDFPDLPSESLEEAQRKLADAGFDRSAVVDWQVALLRRFCPLVVVGHDENGENGDGAHMYNADTLKEALTLAADKGYAGALSSAYAPWSAERCFLHLYEENPVTLDLDIGLGSFGGKTAFEIAREEFALHNSRQDSPLRSLFDHERASEITDRSPCRYGQYFSSDGAFASSADLFYNLAGYDQREREEREKEEAEKEKDDGQTEVQDAPEERGELHAPAGDDARTLMLFGGLILISAVFTIALQFADKRK